MSKRWSLLNRYIALFFVIAGTLWLLIAAKDLLGPLLISALLAYVLNPLVSLANQRAKLPRQWIVFLVYLSTLALLIGAGIAIIPRLPAGSVNLLESVSQITLALEDYLATPIIIFGFELPVNDLLADIGQFSADAIRPDVVVSFFQSISTNLAWILLIIVTPYYLLLDWVRLRNWVFEAVPSDYRHDGRLLYLELRTVWNRYLRGQLALMMIIGILSWLGLAAIGLPGAAVLGLLAGILDVILSVGPAIAMAIAATIALISGSTYLPISNLWVGILVLAIFSAIQMAENIWLRPRIMGQSLRLHPAIVFVGVIGSLTMAGVLAALVIIPVLGSVSVLGRYLYCRIVDIDPWATDAKEAKNATH